MHIFEELENRGLVQDVSDREGLLESVKPGDFCYVGFDPTAPSLQLGNMVPLSVAMRLAEWGLRPIVLFGGATGAIGDPSGKSEERKLLSREVIDNNVAHQTEQAKAIFERRGISAEFVNNHEWFKDKLLLEYLRDVGKHFTVNYMLAKETVKTRVEGEGISFTEFSYMTIQAADFLHLLETKNCRVQFGGSDQWGNITAGLELIRRRGAGEAFAFSLPLITDGSGKKYGKSEGGSVWLDPEMTSPYKLHQFLLNTEDAMVGKLLRAITFLSLSDIENLERSLAEEPEKRLAQKTLADEFCALVHGEEATVEAKQSAEVLFGGSIRGLSENQLLDIFGDVPSVSLSRSEVGQMKVLDIFVAAQAVKSKGEARRLVQAGGAYVNNERVSDSEALVADQASLERKVLVLRTGKKKYFLVRVD